MSRLTLAFAVASVLAAAACSGASIKDSSPGGGSGAPPTSANASDKCKGVALTSPEVGVTDKAITVTVIADTGSPIKPGLFQGSVDGVKAWAAYTNANGGLACRQVVVKSADSKLSASDAKAGVTTACENSMALVGTTALFLQDISGLQNCNDKAGKRTGLPDLPLVQTEPAHQCSDLSYAVLPYPASCPYDGRGPRTYTMSVAQYDWYLKNVGTDLHGIYVVPTDLNSTIAVTTPLFAVPKQRGITADKEFGESGLAAQPAYTPVAQAMKQYHATYARNGLDYSGTVMMRKEAQAQGVTSVKVWDCSTQCYDQRLISTGGSAVDGQYVWLNALPLEDKDANPQLAALFKYEGQQGHTPDSFAEEGWLAGELFARAVSGIVDAQGPNALTRANLLAAIRDIHDFTGGGMAPSTDVGAKKVSPCVVGLQVQHGKFVRIDPTTPGQFDCKDNQTITFTIDPMTAFKG